MAPSARCLSPKPGKDKARLRSEVFYLDVLFQCCRNVVPVKDRGDHADKKLSQRFRDDLNRIALKKWQYHLQNFDRTRLQARVFGSTPNLFCWSPGNSYPSSVCCLLRPAFSSNGLLSVSPSTLSLSPRHIQISYPSSCSKVVDLSMEIDAAMTIQMWGKIAACISPR
jgi:hypothetical protein